MSLIDSAASFEARAVELGLGDHISKMRDMGMNTYAKFAFAANHTPGQIDEKAFQAQVIVPLLGQGNTVLVPVIRRLFSSHSP